MDSKIFNKYKTVADIINNAMQICKNLIKEGVEIKLISNTSDEYILEELKKHTKMMLKD